MAVVDTVGAVASVASPLVVASFPRSRGKYFRKLIRIRIEWQALRGWLRSGFWTYLSAEYLFPTSDCELQCVGRLLDGIALYSVRFYAVHFTNENSNQIPNTLMCKNWTLCQFILQGCAYVFVVPNFCTHNWRVVFPVGGKFVSSNVAWKLHCRQVSATKLTILRGVAATNERTAGCPRQGDRSTRQ